MPFKNPDAKAAWRAARADKNRAEGRAFRERQRAHKSAEIEVLEPLARARAYLEQAPTRNHLAKAIAALFPSAPRRRPHTPEAADKHRRYRERIRLDAIAALGGCCECCGMDAPDVLEFDHRKALLRRTNGIRTRDTTSACREILAGGAALYMLLCANCHTLKTRLNGEHTSSPVDLFSGLMERVRATTHAPNVAQHTPRNMRNETIYEGVSVAEALRKRSLDASLGSTH